MQSELIRFNPETASYCVWHPTEVMVTENEKHTVTITPPNTSSHLTLSSYTAERDVNENILKEFFEDRTVIFSPVSQLCSIKKGNNIWIEREFSRDGISWTWWAISHANKIILASVYSEGSLSPEDRDLYTFILEKLEIYPGSKDK